MVLSEFIILRIADNCACSFECVTLCSVPTTDDTHLMNFDSHENARRATLPVEVVPPLGSGWSILNPVFSSTSVLTNIIEFLLLTKLETM